MKRLLSFVLLCSIMAAIGFSYPALRMPVVGGESMRCDQGYSDPQVTHQPGSSLEFAWDFNLSGTLGNADLGLPVVACADGVVRYAQDYSGIPNDPQADPWGKCVAIEFNNDPSGHSGLYAHLEKIFVQVGESVLRGQVIGTIGDADGRYVNMAHLHYQVQSGNNPNSQSVEAEFEDVGLPVEGGNYISQNTNLLDQAYDRFGQSLIGNREYDMWDLVTAQAANPNHPWYYTWTASNPNRENNISNNCVIQHLDGGTYGNAAIVYDGLGGSRKAYVLHSGFWVYWTTATGPLSDLGMPITDEYSIGANQVRQDFQLGYLSYEQGANPEVTSHGYTSGTYAPGWTNVGWNPQYSYLFAQKYEELGGQPEIGDAISTVYKEGNTYVQEFDGPSFGQCHIVFDSEDQTVNRVRFVCPPSCSLVDMIPAGTSILPDGQLSLFQVRFKNEGNSTWSNDENSPNYVELKACDVNGDVLHDGSQVVSPLVHHTWNDDESPCSMVEHEVAPGEVATFVFKGLVTDPNGNGATTAYFRPHHASGVLMDGWGNMHFQLDVRANTWFATIPQPDCVGPSDPQPRRWFDPEFLFMPSQWAPANVPNNGWGCDFCDRVFRLWFDYEGTESGQGIMMHFQSDDGIAIWVNGIHVGTWGTGCHGAGCVNGNPPCSPNYFAPDIDITSYLQQGKNLIAAHVSDWKAGEYFNMTLTTDQLNITTHATCCLGGGLCQEITSAYPSTSCLADGGIVYVGNWFNCATFSPCENQQYKGKSDPTLFLQGPTPIPTFPSIITFDLIDTLPRTAWYEIPSIMGSDTITVNDFTGQVTVSAINSQHPDTVDLTVVDYQFTADSVSIGGIETGPNHVDLDTSSTSVGTYCISTGLIDITVNSVITNDFYFADAPIRGRSQIRGRFDNTTGILVVGSIGYNSLPIPLAVAGDVNGNASCNIADVVYLISYIFAGGPEPLPVHEAGDVNCDAFVNIADVTFLIAYIFAGGESPCIHY